MRPVTRAPLGYGPSPWLSQPFVPVEPVRPFRVFLRVTWKYSGSRALHFPERRIHVILTKDRGASPSSWLPASSSLRRRFGLPPLSV